MDVAHLDVALQIAADAPSLGRIVVLGHHPEVTAHRERLDSARGQLAAQGGGVALDALASVIERGRILPPAPRSRHQSELARRNEVDGDAAGHADQHRAPAPWVPGRSPEKLFGARP
ncbi:hypothetical protein [Streptomyces platensis]|uniref:hypothetical protein n=1 Tax=Streptomyces platensis TaxID=58346 RepID=UPI0036812F8A